MPACIYPRLMWRRDLWICLMWGGVSLFSPSATCMSNNRKEGWNLKQHHYCPSLSLGLQLQLVLLVFLYLALFIFFFFFTIPCFLCRKWPSHFFFHFPFILQFLIIPSLTSSLLFCHFHIFVLILAILHYLHQKTHRIHSLLPIDVLVLWNKVMWAILYLS